MADHGGEQSAVEVGAAEEDQQRQAGDDRRQQEWQEDERPRPGGGPRRGRSRPTGQAGADGETEGDGGGGHQQALAQGGEDVGVARQLGVPAQGSLAPDHRSLPVGDDREQHDQDNGRVEGQEHQAVNRPGSQSSQRRRPSYAAPALDPAGQGDDRQGPGQQDDGEARRRTAS